MNLAELTDGVEAVSRMYAETHGFRRDDVWLLLKLHEEVGELTQAFLARSGQARAKGRTPDELDAALGAELADGSPASTPPRARAQTEAMIRRAVVAPIAALLLTAACGHGAQQGATTSSGTSPSSPSSSPEPVSSAASTPSVSPTAISLPPAQRCANPTSPDDARLGQYLAIEATITPGPTGTDGLPTRLDLSDVKVLWEAVRGNTPPRTLGGFLLEPGRYVVLLGAGTAGHWYPAMGYSGFFAYEDEKQQTLTELCVVYASDGKAHPAVRAPGSISRQTLLTLVKAAQRPDPLYSPQPAA